MSHVCPGIERLDEELIQRDRFDLPSQFLQIRVEPNLKRLGRHRLDPLDHMAPSRVAGDELTANVRQRADADAQHDKIEIARYPQFFCGDPSAIPVRFEIPFFATQALSAAQLPVIRFGGPTGHSADVDQWPIFAPALVSAWTSNSSASTYCFSPAASPFGSANLTLRSRWKNLKVTPRRRSVS